MTYFLSSDVVFLKAPVTNWASCLYLVPVKVHVSNLESSVVILLKFVLSLPHPKVRERSECPSGGLAREEVGTVLQVAGRASRQRKKKNQSVNSAPMGSKSYSCPRPGFSHRPRKAGLLGLATSPS